jgi:hypothetical protein
MSVLMPRDNAQYAAGAQALALLCICGEPVGPLLAQRLVLARLAYQRRIAAELEPTETTNQPSLAPLALVGGDQHLVAQAVDLGWHTSHISGEVEQLGRTGHS